MPRANCRDAGRPSIVLLFRLRVTTMRHDMMMMKFPLTPPLPRQLPLLARGRVKLIAARFQVRRRISRQQFCRLGLIDFSTSPMISRYAYFSAASMSSGQARRPRSFSRVAGRNISPRRCCATRRPPIIAARQGAPGACKTFDAPIAAAAYRRRSACWLFKAPYLAY